MTNIARSSKFKIRADLGNSHGSYLVDKNTGKEYLDFFSMYSSLPLGYNHQIFKTDEFQSEVSKILSAKITNCEFISDEAESFDKEFKTFAGLGKYEHIHYCCTGALAVESAIKTAIDYKKTKEPKILSFVGAFHGINSWGCFTTSRNGPVQHRLKGFPSHFSIKTRDDVSKDFLENIFANDNITAVLVEPIQATLGDHYISLEFIKTLRELCDKYDIPLIFDEVQIGFGATGKVWYFEHLGVEPDILIFGKRAQLSGIMVKEKFSKIFETPTRLEVTWDGTIIDMIRCKYIIKAYKEYDILNNVKQSSDLLADGLKSIKDLKNVRNCGLIMAFDFENAEICKKYSDKMFDRGMLFNKTGDKTIRFRPSLALSKEELEESLKIIFSI